jgi:GNAT superfamily N-acetyltransferase
VPARGSRYRPVVDTWTAADLSAVVSVVDAAFPGEDLTADEVQSGCFEDPDPSAVFGLPGGEGTVAVVARPSQGGPVASVLLLAVEPSARGEGRGRRLLQAAEEWAFDAAGAVSLSAGGSAPFFLWPGVDVHWIPALCLFESAGYLDSGAVLLSSFPASYRAEPPPGVELRRVVSDEDAELVQRFCAEHWPASVAEIRRAVEHATCFLALAEAGVGEEATTVGLVCHSVNRTGWVGAMAVESGHRHRGIGSALLGAVTSDLRVSGTREAHICPGRPIRFFARVAGATTSRTFVRLRRSP